MGADVLAIAYGITVAMWAVAYVCRLPVVEAPSAVVAILALAAPIAGGWIAGARTRRGWKGGAAAGAVAGVLNLLILGSLLSGTDPGHIRPMAAIYVPGSILGMALLGGLGAIWGSRSRVASREEPAWTAVFARVAVSATFLLLVAGGIVTSNAAGLAVVDWPNSYGYNMFLYPLSRMTGGIYYEHAHRLLGSLVGLTTLTLAILLFRTETRRWVKGLGGLAFVLVVFQGILGGLRVTGKFTMSDDPTVTEPNVYLAVAHGVLAQIFFALLCAIAVVTSRLWKEGPERVTARPPAVDRIAGPVLIGLLLTQLTLGAVQRHLSAGLWIHIAMALVVAGLAVSVGARAWGFHSDKPPLKRAGLVLIFVTGLQLALGFGAFVVIGGLPTGVVTGPWNVVVRTAHQGTGAVLLASALVCVLWWRRRVAAEAVETIAEGAPAKG